jgi:hypothetical protein
MKKNVFIFLVSCVCAILASNALAAGEKIIFLHHSTGGNVYKEGNVQQWLHTYNPSLEITERAYPTSGYPWANYPYDYWNLWINGECQPGNSGMECLDNLADEYDVIIFKHCFPGAAIQSDIGTPDVTSDRKSLENYKAQYRALRDEMDRYPDSTFIIWTLAPLHRLATNPDQAARAWQFVQWVKHDFLTEDGNVHPNIFIFDFFGIVAEKRPDPPAGQQYCLRYEYERSHSGSDSHPNRLANETAGPLFARCIADAVTRKPPVAKKAEAYGSMMADSNYNPAEDEDGDGDVDGRDIL